MSVSHELPTADLITAVARELRAHRDEFARRVAVMSANGVAESSLEMTLARNAAAALRTATEALAWAHVAEASE